MLGLIVVAIMMGYPTAFTLMGLGLVFGFIAFWAPGAHCTRTASSTWSPSAPMAS